MSTRRRPASNSTAGRGVKRALLPLDFLPRTVRKSELTQVRILEAAVRCYATMGFDSAAFDKIAKVAGVSRALIIRYFTDRETLFLASIKYIRHLFQKRAVEAVAQTTNARDELIAYVESTFDWIAHDHDHAAVWMLFFYHCAIRKASMSLNTGFVQTGEARLRQILSAGGFPNPKVRAKQVQLIITGVIVSLLTETPWASVDKIKKDTVALCLKTALLT